jgi:hypothetical protein
MTECILATLPGENPTEQVVVVLLTTPGQATRVSLRQQSWGEGIGWYTQTTINLGTDQVAGLRTALGKSGARFGGSTPARPVPAGLRLAQVESA